MVGAAACHVVITGIYTIQGAVPVPNYSHVKVGDVQSQLCCLLWLELASESSSPGLVR